MYFMAITKTQWIVIVIMVLKIVRIYYKIATGVNASQDSYQIMITIWHKIQTIFLGFSWSLFSFLSFCFFFYQFLSRNVCLSYASYTY
uniref:Uncharacterized protein n=1 Tax=Onchocerca volvulus TaxID=6282 RepID=A0A8R1XYB8_ONCVO